MQRVTPNYGRPHGSVPPAAGAKKRSATADLTSNTKVRAAEPAARSCPQADRSPMRAQRPKSPHSEGCVRSSEPEVEEEAEEQVEEAPGAAPIQELKVRLKEQLELEGQEQLADESCSHMAEDGGEEQEDEQEEEQDEQDEQEEEAAAAAEEEVPEAAPAAELPAAVTTVELVMQTEPPPPGVDMAAQTAPAERADAGCQCDIQPAAAQAEADMDCDEAKKGDDANDPFAFGDDSAAGASAADDADAAAAVARRKEQLLAEATALAAREAASGQAQLRAQITSLEFANDLLLQQLGEARNNCKALATKEQMARVALTNQQQGHAKEVKRWQEMMDSTVGTVQGQMQQVLEGTAAKIKSLQDAVAEKDAELAQLRGGAQPAAAAAAPMEGQETGADAQGLGLQLQEGAEEQQEPGEEDYEMSPSPRDEDSEDPTEEEDQTEGHQVIPPVPSLFTLLRPYLAHFFPVFSRFLRVFTVSPRRFQRAPSRNPGPRNGGARAKSGELRPSFDTSGAVGRITCSCPSV